MTEVIQVIVSFPPRLDAIRDYAIRLAQGLPTLGTRSASLTAEAGDDGAPTCRLAVFRRDPW
jgi:hypothetical protein